MTEGHSTPWGAAQTVRQIVAGIEVVTTAGHGGVHLDAAHAAKVPKAIAEASFLGLSAWFEEDCDWCIPFVIFEDEIKAGGDEHSRGLIEDGLPRKCFALYHKELKGVAA